MDWSRSRAGRGPGAMVRRGSLALLILTSGLSAFPNRAAVGAGRAERGVRVTCNDWVGTAQVTPGPLRALGMSFSLAPGANVVGSQTQDGLLFAKFGVHLLPNHAITIKMLTPSAGLGGMHWAPNTPNAGTLHFDPCRSTPTHDPVAQGHGFFYAGGVDVTTSTCVRLRITTGRLDRYFNFTIRASGDSIPTCT